MQEFLRLMIFSTLLWYSSANPLESTQNLGTLSNKLVRVIESCFKDRITHVIHQDSGNDVIKAFSSSMAAARVIINDNLNLAAPFSHRNRLPLFLTTAASSAQLRVRLQTFLNSGWNERDTKVFALSSTNVCNSAKSILETMRNMNVVTGFFVCYNEYSSATIYTYNPIASSLNWSVEQQTDGWTVFYRQLDPGSNSCEGYKFDVEITTPTTTTSTTSTTPIYYSDYDGDFYFLP